MSKNSKKEEKQLSVMDKLSKAQTQLDSLSFGSKAIDSIMPRMAKYEQMNSAASIAIKAFQQSSLIPAYFENQSAIARFAQSRAEGAVAFQDSALEMTKGMSAYDDIMATNARSLGLADSACLIAQHNGLASQAISSIYERHNIAKILSDATSASRFPDAMYEQLDIASRYKDLVPLSIADSFAAKQAVAFQQFDQFSVLESFKALSRLENFPFDSIVNTDSDIILNLEENVSATVLELDSKISDELSTIDDFNQLSEERQSILLSLYNDYYYPIILTYLVIGIWWNIFLNENLNLSNKIFVYFESTKGVLSYLSDNFYHPSSGVIDGLVATFIYMKLSKFKKNSKTVGVKKAIKMLFDYSDSVIDRSMLEGCRVITEDGTNLRENHHIDAIEIEILSKGTIVRVVGKEGKSWLLVEPLFNTEIGKGWVLRSNTTTFK